MKKNYLVPAFSILAILLLIMIPKLLKGGKTTGSLDETSVHENAAPQLVPKRQALSALPGVSKIHAVTGDNRELLELALHGQITPAGIEKFAEERSLALEKLTKGNPQTGERLEMTLATSPTTTVTFDILLKGKHQFSSLRRVHPAGTDINQLKSELKETVSSQVQLEDSTTLVFLPDTRGFVAWLQGNDDSTIKVAYEFLGVGTEH